MRFLQALRSSRQKSKAVSATAVRNVIESLESRTLLNAAVTNSVPTQNVGAGATTANVALTSYFKDASVTGTPVVIKTTEGNIPIDLYPNSQVGTTVQNFLSYVNSGAYNGTYIHRVVTVASQGIGIVQGGGYKPDSNSHIPTNSPIPLQYNFPNTTGTIAMARTQSQNSATSEFFFNAADNSQTLGQSNGGGYAVFGQVLYSGMTVVNTIYDLPLQTYGPFTSTPAQVPVVNYTSGSVQPSNLVTINSAQVVQPLTFTATSDNPALVGTTVSGNNLGLTYGNGSGTAHVTVTATDLGGSVATATFAVNAGSAATSAVTIGKGAAAKLVRFTDPDGTAAEVRISGAGTATLSFGGPVITATSKSGIATVTGTPTSVSLSTTGTDKSTNVTITGKGGNGVVDLTGITTDAPVHSITGKNTALTGNVQAAGGLANLTLNSTTNGIIGLGTGTAINLNINSGGNESINSGATINSLTAGSWGAGATIHAATITRANIKNGFAADISTVDVGNLHAGSITGGTWTVTNITNNVSARTADGWAANFKTLSLLAISGAFDNSTINASGNIDTVTAGSMNGTKVFTGVAAGVTTLPTSGSQFSAPNSLNTFHVARTFANSDVAAGSLGRLSAGVVQVANNGTPFGFAGGAVLTFDGRVGGRHLHLLRVTNASQVTSAVKKQGVTMQDFAINIV